MMKSLHKAVLIALTVGAISGGTSMLALAHEATENDAASVTSAAITLEQAVSIAKTTIPGTVAKADYSTDEGTAVWEVEIVDANQAVFDMEIDATTGNVLKQQADSADNGDDEGDDEKDGKEDRD